MKILKTKNKKNLAVILTAAGSSARMGGEKKEYLPLETGTVLSTSLKKFLTSTNALLFVVTVPKQGKAAAQKAINLDSEVLKIIKQKNAKVIYTTGGDTRQSSVFNALKKIAAEIKNENLENDFFVAIHDAARPFVSGEVILRTYEMAKKNGASFPFLEPVETQKMIDENGVVKNHLKRSELASVQTPQIFEFKKIFEAHKKAAAHKFMGTDDTELWGKYIGEVFGVIGDEKNIKITYPKDYLSAREGEEMTRIGLGHDLHKLVNNRKLLIGGVHIPFEKGEEGHSDGDVLLHAITDALLGAAGMGDIGSFFPPEDKKWKDADSKKLLKSVWTKILNAGFYLQNLDCVIKLEKPKFLPYRNQVIASVSKILEVNENQIFVKAKTYENTEGAENKIEADVVCLLSKNIL